MALLLLLCVWALTAELKEEGNQMQMSSYCAVLLECVSLFVCVVDVYISNIFCYLLSSSRLGLFMHEGYRPESSNYSSSVFVDALHNKRFLTYCLSLSLCIEKYRAGKHELKTVGTGADCL